MDCIFCKIVNGEISSYKVYEDANYLAFLTIMPINPGHTLLIPKKHVPYIFDLDDQTLADLLLKAKPIAQALKKAFNPETGKIGVMVAGSEVPHAHLHLIPMNQESDLTFVRQKQATAEELAENLTKIKKS